MAIGDPEWVQDQINAAMAQQSVALPPAMPRASPDDGTRPGWLSLFGEALGGGQTPGYRLRGREEDAAGSRALLNFGIQTLLASGPQRVRPDVLSAVATGLQGAQQSIDVDQRRAGAAAQADYNQRLETAKLGVEQGRDKIERLKAVLPLLQMQRVQGSQLPWETSSAAPAGTPAPPVDKATFLQQTAKRESGGDPTALNYVAQQDPTAYDRGATASGKYQIVNSTWREGLQLAGLDPSKYATARDAPEKVQDQVASAIYDKYGTKPWQKGAKDWVKDEQGRYQLATVRPAAGAPGAPAPAPRPPPAPPAPDAGNQFSGPGVPTGGAVQPPSPAVAGDVAAIQAGMDQARAAPGVQVAQAGPPAATPGVAPSPGADDEFDAYRAKRPIRFTPEQEATFKIAPDQGTLATLAQQERIAMQEAAIARRNGDQAGIDKATAAWQSIQTAKAKALDEATEKGRAARAAATEAEIGRQYKDFEAARTQRGEIEKEARAQERAIALAKLQGDETRRTEAAKSENSYVLDERKRFGTERDGARASIDGLQMLRALSDNAGKTTPLDNIVVGNMTGATFMNNLGLGTQAQREKWSAQQAFNAAKNQLIINLRSGVQMGALSDRDMSFLKDMGPDLLQDPSTRSSIIGILENAQIRKLRYADAVEELYDGGKGVTKDGKPMTWSMAKRQADKDLGPLIPSMPEDAKGWDTKTRNAWIKQYVPPKTIYRSPGGDMLVAPGGY